MDKYPHRQFSALGDPTRLSVFVTLLDGPASVTDLAKPFSMALPPFTKHLGILENCGLIQTKKQGRTRICSINPKALDDLSGWFADRQLLWEKRLDNLEEHLNSK